jgi:heme-degrading monooxygenase HmoA
MICVQFIFTPGEYDDEFHRLDGVIEAFARSLPGFVRIETWQSADGLTINATYYFTDREALGELSRFPQHLEAKGQVARWYDGYRIVVSEVVTTYGDGRLLP